MPIYNGGGGGVGGITVETDPSALKIASNLSDIQNFATARSNLQLSTYYSAVGHNHNGTYAPVSHSHAISDVTNLQTTLNGKASSTHTHDVTDVTGWGNVNGASNGYVLGWNGTALVWVAQSGGIADAPADGVKYGRINGTWSAITEGVNGQNGLGFTYKGGWAAYTQYAVNDWVSYYNGSTNLGYLCIAATDSATSPDNLTSNWVPCGGQGPEGPAGQTGATGATGAQGPAGDVSYTGLVDHFINGSNNGPTTNGSAASGYVLTNVGGSSYNWVALPSQVVSSASAGTNNSGYSNGNFDTSHYPQELALNINGTTYYVPART